MELLGAAEQVPRVAERFLAEVLGRARAGSRRMAAKEDTSSVRVSGQDAGGSSNRRSFVVHGGPGRREPRYFFGGFLLPP